jgi:hypothetical protein
MQCPYCNEYYYYGTTHACTIYPIYYPNNYTYSYPALSSPKPNYEDHTLECGCKVKTVVVEHCETLHSKPKDE